MNETSRGHTVRKDIEGLRALAVLSVLINHAFPNVLPGGFVGVDVFFVISGYLIGRHLLQDIQANRFNILAFYGKRARRIFPALALVLLCVWGVGWRVFSGPEFSALGRQIVASAFFSNNFVLWSESGYFDVAASDKPLLHLWSLGIEEQFYLLVPAMLWLGSKGSAASVRWVAGLGVLSLLATVGLGSFDDPASFYLLHTRFWELAVGVVLAQADLRMRVAHPPMDIHRVSAANQREVLLYAAAIVLVCAVVLGSSEQRWQWNTISPDIGLALLSSIAAFAVFCVWRKRLPRILTQDSVFLPTTGSLVGIILLCGSALALDSTDWPGPQTLFPVLGSAMLIAATPTAPVNKVLESRTLGFVGGISYPLYLWHWPAIVFWRLLHPEARAIAVLIPLFIAMALAFLTKTLFEDPVRFGRLGAASFARPRLQVVFGCLIGAAGLGAIAVATDGFPSRIPPQLQSIATWSEPKSHFEWRAGRCYYGPQASTEFLGECTPVKRPNIPLVLLWGDSHAAHLYPGLADLRSTHDFDVIQWTAGLCPPSTVPIAGETPTCAARRATALAALSDVRPDTILLAGAWEVYLAKTQSEAEILRALSETIRRLEMSGDREIVVFGPGPTWNPTLATDLYRFMVAKKLNAIPERYGHAFEAAWHLDAMMADRARELGVHYVSVLKFFCDKSGCRTVGDRTKTRPDLLFSDSNHLSVSGSEDLMTHSDLHLF